jgi:hypothetical protein
VSETNAEGSFFARENTLSFVDWASSFGIDKSVLFESGDLVENKNEKNVLYTCVTLACASCVADCRVQADGDWTRAARSDPAQTCAAGASPGRWGQWQQRGQLSERRSVVWM